MNVVERLPRSLFLGRGGSRERSYQPPIGAPERVRSERYFRNFVLPSEIVDDLSENEKTILRNLLWAAELGERIFARQEGTGSWPNFFPQDATKREIIAAAQKEPAIDDHYTVVVRDESTGSLTVKPFHLHYAETKEMAKYLEKAANAAGSGKERDFQLQAYLRAMATAFTRGNYKPVVKYWLQRSDEPKIDVVLGFYDAYTDTVLGRKFAFEAWISLLNPAATQDAQQFTDSFLEWWKQKTGLIAPNVKARYGYDLAITGQAVKYRWSANSLPCQPDWRARYGSKFTIFGSVFKDSMPERLHTFRNAIDPARRIGVTDGLVKRVTLRQLIGHEISHSLGIEEGYDKRLREHASWVKELYCDLLALQGYSQLNVLNHREAEIALAVTLAKGRLEYNAFKREGRRQEYYLASSILLKHCLDQGNVSIINGHLTWSNPSEVLAKITNLFEMVQQLLRSGGVRDAELFLKNHLDPEIYSRVLYKDSNFKPLYAPREGGGSSAQS